MKKQQLFTGILTGLVAAGCNGGSQTLPQLGKNSIDEVISAMTREEKVMLLLGCGQEGAGESVAVVGQTDEIIPGAAGTTHGVPRLGIPAIVLADGPAGLRISPERKNQPGKTFYCTAFPIASMLSSTWNAELIEKVGEAMGQEVKEYGADIILGPGVNIHRNPLCGRNYEYYSEDPFLAGTTAAAIIRGIQKNDVGTSIKHFAANNQETFRTSTDSRVSQRALREIYLKPFEIAVRDAAPWTVMTSYNYLNGTYTSESKELNESVLRKDFGFKGLVMTDWFAGRDALKQVSSGNDLLMPGTDRQHAQITEGLKNGTLSEADINANVKHILELILRTPRFQGYKFSDNPDLQAHAEITRQSASEGLVLLTNKNFLPLTKEKKAAVFGTNSYEFVSGGTGSGDVNEKYTVSLTEGLRNAGLSVDEKLEKIYRENIESQRAVRNADPSHNDFFGRFMPENFTFKDADLASYAKENDFAVVTIGRCSGEFKDRRIADFYLSENEKTLLSSVIKAFKKLGKKTVVILNTGGVIETASWVDLPDAVLLGWMGGQEGGNAVADALTGKVNPSGKLPVSFAADYFDYPSAKNFPYDYEANNKSMFGRGDERGNEENLDFTNYYEDIFVGYRYFETFGKKPRFPFGYGLSYTQFAFSDFSVSEDKKGVVSLEMTVKNTGETAGKEVAQFYVSLPPEIADRPSKELKRFVKTPLLQPGESYTCRVNIPLKDNDLMYFNTEKSSWILAQGVYTFYAGNSSENLPLKQTLEISTPGQIQCSNVLAPKNLETMKR